MNNLPAVMAASADYEPLPRSDHVSGRVGSLIVVQGGRTEESEQHLSSVVEIFDPYSESWEQRQVEGNAPLPGTYIVSSASLHDDLFSFGGTDDKDYFNTVHRLDTKTWCWSQVSPQNAHGAPMPKIGSGMIAFRNSLVVFGGYGRPQGPTEPQSFVIRSGKRYIHFEIELRVSFESATLAACIRRCKPHVRSPFRLRIIHVNVCVLPCALFREVTHGISITQ